MSNKDQAIFAESFVALKRALKRKAYDSDSDSSIDQNTNRGNKLKKRARFVRRGQLSAPNGPSIYKETVEHSGYRREILGQNPPLIDEDGYAVESDDDEENTQEALASAAELNPYAGIRLENILAPLTSVTELPNHPTLSRPFTSKALTELTMQGNGWMHKENAALWKVRPLLTKLCGDHTWIPCGMMVADSDVELFDDDLTARNLSSGVNGSASEDMPAVNTPKLNGEGSSQHTRETVDGAAEQDLQADTMNADQPESTDGDVVMEEANDNKPAPTQVMAEKEMGLANGEKGNPDSGESRALSGDEPPARDDDEGAGRPHEASNGAVLPETKVLPKDGREANEAPEAKTVVTDRETSVSQAADAKHIPGASVSELNGSRAMSNTPDVFEDHFIHPLFLGPKSAHPDRDLRLPEHEAEDVRRLLQLWVQKQDEVTRGTRKLYAGLLKADRLRKTVLKWSKAEAHCGPNRDLSDGEDWYDKEEWGLLEDLKKGHDEEEEDQQQTQKKTRNRR